MSARLILLGSVVIAFLALAGVALWYRGEAISAKAEQHKAEVARDTAIAANKESEKTIDQLQEQARLDGRLVAALYEQMQQIHAGIEEQNAKLTDLEKANADVRAYLDTAVPSDLRKLYKH